jgi:CubicO group peptidase (beta-lactamase class C family)
MAACGSSDEERVIDDFESGSLAEWKTETQGAGNWFVYSDGKTPPAPEQSDPVIPFVVPDPPQGRYAAIADSNAPGRRMLFRDLVLDGSYALELTLFYSSGGQLADTSDIPALDMTQQYRIDVMRESAAADSLRGEDILATVFQTTSKSARRCDPTRVTVDLSKWEGQRVRLRLVSADNRGPLRAGVDDIRLMSRSAGRRSDAVPGAQACPATGNELEPETPVARLSEAAAVADLSGYAAELAAADRLSGAALIARDGAILLQAAWGRADREQGVPATLETKFRIGSMNKMFTSVAVLQLVAQGALSLDAPLLAYLPDYPNQDLAGKVTVRHLLTHTGGTGDIFGPEFDQHRLELHEHQDYLDLYRERALLHEPGSEYRYSNYGFVLLGALIEKVTGGSYHDYVQAHVFDPAAMTSTGSLPESEIGPELAVGYRRERDSWVAVTDMLPLRGTAAGGGYSTVGDLLRFAEALQAGVLLSEELLAEATRQHTESYGYGFHISMGPLVSYGHSGGGPGVNGELKIFPKLGYVLISLSNLDPPAASLLLNRFEARMPIEP